LFFAFFQECSVITVNPYKMFSDSLDCGVMKPGFDSKTSVINGFESSFLRLISVTLKTAFSFLGPAFQCNIVQDLQEFHCAVHVYLLQSCQKFQTLISVCPLPRAWFIKRLKSNVYVTLNPIGSFQCNLCSHWLIKKNYYLSFFMNTGPALGFPLI